MGFVKDFRDFAMKGSVLDLAVGVIIGGAFGKIVTSMVDDVLMPVVGLLSHGDSFTAKFIELPVHDGPNKYPSLEEAKKAGVNVFAYGHFIQTVIDFFIVALFVFVVLRAINKIRHKEEKKASETPAPFGPTPTDQLLTEIRDLLKVNNNKQ